MKIDSAHSSSVFDACYQVENEKASELAQYNNTEILDKSDDEQHSHHSLHDFSGTNNGPDGEQKNWPRFYLLK